MIWVFAVVAANSRQTGQCSHDGRSDRVNSVRFESNENEGPSLRTEVHRSEVRVLVFSALPAFGSFLANKVAAVIGLIATVIALLCLVRLCI